VSGADRPATGGGDAFATAHAEVAADRSLQFRLEEAPPPPPPPSWLDDLLQVLVAAGPVLQVLFWLGLAALVLALLWFIGREIIRIRLPGRALPTPPGGHGEEAWRPAPAAALALLSDADALAAEGRFAEAVHLILLRSIGDIDGRLPNTVRPALTARDIGALTRLPSAARPAFAHIARVVEASLFGGRDVDRAAFMDCRQAYESFAFPETWAR
jgi:hypothetical protein